MRSTPTESTFGFKPDKQQMEMAKAESLDDHRPGIKSQLLRRKEMFSLHETGETSPKRQKLRIGEDVRNRGWSSSITEPPPETGHFPGSNKVGTSNIGPARNIPEGTQIYDPRHSAHHQQTAMGTLSLLGMQQHRDLQQRQDEDFLYLLRQHQQQKEMRFGQARPQPESWPSTRRTAPPQTNRFHDAPTSAPSFHQALPRSSGDYNTLIPEQQQGPKNATRMGRSSTGPSPSPAYSSSLLSDEEQHRRGEREKNEGGRRGRYQENELNEDDHVEQELQQERRARSTILPTLGERLMSRRDSSQEHGIPSEDRGGDEKYLRRHHASSTGRGNYSALPSGQYYHNGSGSVPGEKCDDDEDDERVFGSRSRIYTRGGEELLSAELVENGGARWNTTHTGRTTSIPPYVAAPGGYLPLGVSSGRSTIGESALAQAGSAAADSRGASSMLLSGQHRHFATQFTSRDEDRQQLEMGLMMLPGSAAEHQLAARMFPSNHTFLHRHLQLQEALALNNNVAAARMMAPIGEDIFVDGGATGRGGGTGLLRPHTHQFHSSAGGGLRLTERYHQPEAVYSLQGREQLHQLGGSRRGESDRTGRSRSTDPCSSVVGVRGRSEYPISTSVVEQIGRFGGGHEERTSEMPEEPPRRGAQLSKRIATDVGTAGFLGHETSLHQLAWKEGLLPSSFPYTNRSGNVEENLIKKGFRAKILYMEKDESILSSYQCLIRKQIEVFEATEDDVQFTISKMSKPVALGQVGIRCFHCSILPQYARPKAAIYFPRTLDSMYQFGQNMVKNHLVSTCKEIPRETLRKLTALQEERKRGRGGRERWAEAARELGVVETTSGGLRFTDHAE